MHSTQPFITPLPTGVSANHRYVLALLHVASKLLPEWKELSTRMRSKPAIRAEWEARLREHRLRVTSTWNDGIARHYSLVGTRGQVRVVDPVATAKTGRDQLVFREVGSLHELVAAACSWTTISKPRTAGVGVEEMQLRTNSTALLFENLEASGLLVYSEPLIEEHRKVRATLTDTGMAASIDEEQQAMRRRFFVLLDRARAHGDALRSDLPDRQRLAWLAVGEMPVPTEHQLDEVCLRLVPSALPAAGEIFVLAADLSRWITTRSRHYQDLAVRLDQHTEVAWLLAAGDWADAHALDIARARMQFATSVPPSEDPQFRISVEDAIAGREDLGLEKVAYSTLMKWMSHKDKAVILGSRMKGSRKGQMILLAGVRELQRAGANRSRRVRKTSLPAAK